jgi:protein SCO1/2
VAQDALGADSFSVLTIGFDTDADTPARMRAYALSQGVDLPNWRFLATDEDTVRRLSEDLGFIYFPSSKGFDHLAQVTVLDDEGRVYRQVYGESFNSPALVEPLKDLVFGRQGNLTSLSGLIAIAMASLGTIGTLLVRSWLRARRPHEPA